MAEPPTQPTSTEAAEALVNTLNQTLEPLHSLLDELDEHQTQALTPLQADLSSITADDRHFINETFSKVGLYKDRLVGLRNLTSNVEKRLSNVKSKVANIEKQDADFQAL
ncbi:hypothetical protein P9112_007591 [Eukaryota sp. TZLM1-RC]